MPGVPTGSDGLGARSPVGRLLARSGREFVPLRRSFVGRREGPGDPRPPLARFVTGRREHALDLLLLAHALASAPPWDVTEYAETWARALVIGSPDTYAPVISENWSWIESEGLVTSERRNRRRVITLLIEDGTTDPYQRPTRDFFKLPHAYWTAGWQKELDLPAKALLLIALSRGTQFLLPARQGADWYGISHDTIKRGLRTLKDHDLLEVSRKRKPAVNSPTGFKIEHRYTMRPLGPPAAPLAD